MECDLCGKPAAAKATIEGAQLTVCNACAKHGTNVRMLPQQQKAPTRRSIAVATPEPLAREELIETVRKDVGKLLRQHREKLKLNQEQFAAKLQIRASTYNHYESGAALPDITTARKLEQVLKVPIVVHVKVSAGAQKQQDARGMTMGDFLK
jgi:uncharacterized protein (TIGR00270 family)